MMHMKIYLLNLQLQLLLLQCPLHTWLLVRNRHIQHKLWYDSIDGDLTDLAAKWSSDDVVKLLEELDLKDCAEFVRSYKFNGLIMYEYLKMPSSENGLDEIQIKGSVDELRLRFHFRRAVRGGQDITHSSFTPQKLGEVLIANNYARYAKVK